MERALNPSGDTSREHIYNRIESLKQAALIAAIGAFCVLCGLMAHNAVVASSNPPAVQQQQSRSAPSVPNAPDNGGFFNGNSGPSNPPVGPGNGSAPSLGSGAS